MKTNLFKSLLFAIAIKNGASPISSATRTSHGHRANLGLLL